MLSQSINIQIYLFFYLQFIKMEYQLKKQEILSHVQFNNLLSFSLVENKLQRNFRTIVEALMLNQAKTDALNQDHLQFKQNNQKQFHKINDLLQQLQNQLSNLHSQKNNDPKPSIHSIPKLPSHNQVQPIQSKKSLQKLSNHSDDHENTKSLWDQMNQKMNNMQNKWDEQKSDLIKQIDSMKDKLDSVGFLQNELKNFRVDLRIVKDELTNNMRNQAPQSLKHNSSNRTLPKRQSILNMISAKATDKAIQQPSKNTLKNLSKDENKENFNHGIDENKNEQNQQNCFNQGVQKEINLLYLELNTLKISFEELRDLLSESRKQTFKNTSGLSQLKEDLTRQVKTRKKQTQDLQNAVKDLKMQMLNIDTSNNNQSQPQEKTLKESSKTNKLIKRDDEDVNHKNQLNDKISKMQGMIQNLMTATEFNRFKNELNDEIQRLKNKTETLEQNLQNSEKKLEDLIVQYQVNINSDLGELRNRMNEMDQTIKNESNQNQRKNNILNAKIQELKKSLQNLRQDIEFYQSLNAETSKGKNQKKSQDSSKPSQSGQNKTVSAVDDKALEALKKYFSGKMHDLRTNLLGLIRDLEKKLNGKSNGEQEIVKIWDRLNELNLFMNKKADQDDAKKTFIYLEKKINRLNGVLFKNEDNTDDARIARSNQWQCLSCDKNLHSYQGKIGKHLVWDSMPLKGINKSFINQADDKKKGLPQLKK